MTPRISHYYVDVLFAPSRKSEKSDDDDDDGVGDVDDDDELVSRRSILKKFHFLPTRYLYSRFIVIPSPPPHLFLLSSASLVRYYLID